MGAMPGRRAPRILPLLLLLAGASGCAGVTVQPGDLPPRPPPASAGDAATWVLVLSEAPAPMADEMRAIAEGAALESGLAAGEPLDAACAGDGDRRVLRPRAGRSHFASNAPDRNTLFIYETAIVVGIPVTLVSAFAWPYYAETIVEAQLDVLSCADGSEGRHVEAFRLRSEGRGFVRTRTLRDAQSEAALRAVTRKLLSRLMEEDRR